MCFGIRLLQQWQPRLVLVCALRKIQRARPRLPGFAVFFLGVTAVEIVPQGSLVDRLVIVGSPEVEFVIDDGLLPFTVSMESSAYRYYALDVPGETYPYKTRSRTRRPVHSA